MIPTARRANYTAELYGSRGRESNADAGLYFAGFYYMLDSAAYRIHLYSIGFGSTRAMLVLTTSSVSP
jgi:hypothetical protein